MIVVGFFLFLHTLFLSLGKKGGGEADVCCVVFRAAVSLAFSRGRGRGWGRGYGEGWEEGWVEYFA